MWQHVCLCDGPVFTLSPVDLFMQIFNGARLDDMLLNESDVRKIIALPDIAIMRAQLLQVILSEMNIHVYS